jgi:hypothetical protein
LRLDKATLALAVWDGGLVNADGTLPIQLPLNSNAINTCLATWTPAFDSWRLIYKQLYLNIKAYFIQGPRKRQCSVWLHTGWTGFDPRQRRKDFPLASVCRPDLGPTPTSYPMDTGILYRGLRVAEAWRWPFTPI